MDNTFPIAPIVALSFGLLAVLSLIVCMYYRGSTQSEKFSELTAGFQNIVVVLSIFATAAWTIYSFEALSLKTQADSARKKAEAELIEIRKKIDDVASSSIEIKTKLVPYKSEETKEQAGLIIEVTIVNKGNTKIVYDLKNNPLNVYKIKAQGDSIAHLGVLTPSLYDEIGGYYTEDDESVPLDSWISLTQSSRTLSYFVTVDKDSLYYIVFSSPDEEGSTKNDNCKPSESCNWFISKYIFTSS